MSTLASYAAKLNQTLHILASSSPYRGLAIAFMPTMTEMKLATFLTSHTELPLSCCAPLVMLSAAKHLYPHRERPSLGQPVAGRHSHFVMLSAAKHLAVHRERP